MRTDPAAAVTRGGRITPEDLQLAARSRALCAQVVARPAVRQRLRGIGRTNRLHHLLRTVGCRGLERAAVELVDLANAGATAAELALYPAWLAEVVEDLTVGTARAPRLVLERAEQDADAAEDALQVAALCAALTGAETPAMLRERAAALRGQGSASYALAARLEFDARTLERRGAVRHAAA